MIDAHPPHGGLQELDAVAQILDLLGAEAGQALQTVLRKGRLEGRQVDDPALLPEQSNRLGADARQREQGR